MASYIKTLKEDNGDIIYPQTKGSAVLLDGGSDLESVLATKADASTVNQKITVGDVQSTDIVANAVTTAKIANSNVTTAKIADDAVTSAKINWASAKADPDVGDGLGWVYLGQIKLTAAASSLTFTLPAQYNNYKVIFEAEMNGDAASNTWIDFRMMNGSNYISGGYQVQDVNGTNWSAGTYTGIYAVNGTANAYDAVNIEWTSYCQRPGINWRKSQGFFYRVGNGYQTRIHNGRLGDVSIPTAFQVISGSKFQQYATMKVWGSNI